MQARRWGSATGAIVRELIASDEPVVQADLADRCATSQPRVSQVLTSLARLHLVHRTNAGWVSDRPKLIDAYLDRYRPRPIAPEDWWYALDAVAEQARRVAAAHPDLVVSADAAPDLVAPWRRPSSTIIWSLQPVDLADLQFVNAESRAAATVIIRYTDDQRLFSEARIVGGMQIASRLQQATDLVDLGGGDRMEAIGPLLAREPV